MSLTVTVSQVNRRLSLMVKGDKTLQDICVKGEISNFKYHYQSGHIYFSLKDDESSIKAVMFRSNAEKLMFEPENGMSVIVRGSVQVFERDGICQLYAADIQPDGLGGIYLAFEQLKEKLSAEGLFDRKRPIPAMPASICIVTSKTGAALQDMLNILGRRDPLVKLKLVPALVQGADAPQSIVSALEKAQNSGADLIIIGRGGGSIEDLQAFNSEAVARAIFASDIPVISAVGHETDFTIADFVADLRAPTPSAAAELAVPDLSTVKERLLSLKQNLYEKVSKKIAACEREVKNAEGQMRLYSPTVKISQAEKRASELYSSVCGKFVRIVENKEQQLLRQEQLLNAVNPFGVLARGYAVVYKNNKPVNSTDSLEEGDLVKIRLNDGYVTAAIRGIETGKDVENDL